jgi:phage FluMu protein Com
MRLDLKDGLSEEMLARICRDANGTPGLKNRPLICHYCGHKVMMLFEDTRGHVEIKCRKCDRVSTYNIFFRRDGRVMFRRIKN